jgi:hypothetical protein
VAKPRHAFITVLIATAFAASVSAIESNPLPDRGPADEQPADRPFVFNPFPDLGPVDQQPADGPLILPFRGVNRHLAPHGPIRVGWITPCCGIHVTIPTMAELSLGVIIGTVENEKTEKLTLTSAQGLFLSLRPGIAGFKCNVGYASVIVHEPEWGVAVLGFAVSASYMRTWKNAVAAEDNRSYGGISFEGAFLGSFEVGLYTSIDGGDEDTVVSVGVGVGL